MQFIQLDNVFLNINDIIRVELIEQGAKLHITTREIVSGYGDYGTGIENQKYAYDINSPEAQALLKWLSARTEVLVSEQTVGVNV